MNKSLKMIFKDNNGKNKTITVNNPKDEYNENEVSNAMDTIIGTNAIETEDGVKISRKLKAYIQTTTLQEIKL
ncbi:MAG: DUF2922 domain-containing protein [Peptoniphilaceae bacterium]|nr:DUF2922 domain-containing protein [Peptoniphilaceae bacterium]MDD7383837.1 DUF2922 domain-containing protein [Peptoniphilaceae bacterium]MDY3737586.1 DUF2922 domain-containing protein [Peptoniphilaceae bacterium]